MNRDPLRERILRQLENVSDDQLFEACVCDLLRPEWTTLIPVPGGDDAGVDGAWADNNGRGILIATANEDVIGNVTKNLREHIKKGRTGAQVLVATSRTLTPRRCRNIEKRIRELGFSVAHHPYTRQAIADRLYYNSYWLRELLGLSGVASALSTIPIGLRPLRDLPLIGREDDLAWLCNTAGDRLVIGQPGIGKTFLLQTLVERGLGLFAIDSDIHRLADSIRDQKPSAILVEDAHLQLDLLRDLQHFREETGSTYAIVADSWPGSAASVRQTLALRDDQCRGLAVLPPASIVELVKAAGIHGPNHLLHQIVRQSMGYPGRAALLAYLCRRDSVKEVYEGHALTSWVKGTFVKSAGERALLILAAFAIGGDVGVPVTVVSQILGYPIGDIHLEMAKLAHGGIVYDLGDATYCVLPEPLRSVIVREYFYGSPALLAMEPFLCTARRPGAVVDALIGAQVRGAGITPHELLTLAERVNDGKTWEHLLWSDETNARVVCERRPDLAAQFREPLLHNAPEFILPVLLTASVGDERALHSHPDHPLRQIDDWIKGAGWQGGEAFRRRSILWSAVKAALASKLNDHVCFQAIASAVTPEWELTEQSPSDWNSYSIRSGSVQIEDLQQIAGLWSDIIATISEREITKWPPLLRALDTWVYPRPRSGQLPPEYKEVLEATARSIVVRFGDLANGNPGVLSELRKRAAHLDFKCDFNIDDDFARLFPDDPFDSEHGYRARQEEQTADALRLVDDLLTRDRDDVARKLSWCVKEAAKQSRTYPDYSTFVCAKIADGVADTEAWLESMISAGATSSMVYPFLEKLASRALHRWWEHVQRCLGRPDLQLAGLSVGLSCAESNEALELAVIEKSRQFPQVVENECLLERVPNHRLHRLLMDLDPLVAGSAATGLFAACRHKNAEIPPALQGEWRQAVVRGVRKEHSLEEMFKQDPVLAFSWLLNRSTEDERIYRSECKAIRAAAEVLSNDQRIALLGCASDKPFHAREIVAALVGSNPDLYRHLLRDADRAKLHLAPLRRNPSLEWATLAIVALDEGLLPEDVGAVATDTSNMWGSIADKHIEESEAWSTLLDHSDIRIRKIAERATEQALVDAAKWREREGSGDPRRIYVK